MSSDGRAFMLGADKLPGGRGHGEPIRLSIDLEDSVDIVTFFAAQEGRKRLVASDAGYGFMVPEEELISTRKAGKAIVSVGGEGRLAVCEIAQGDYMAVIGTNKKLLIFEAAELPEMPRGKGVKLQAYRGNDQLSDAMVFDGEDGLIVIDGAGRHRGIAEWRDWVGKRAQAGRVAPKGFPRSGKLNG